MLIGKGSKRAIEGLQTSSIELGKNPYMLIVFFNICNIYNSEPYIEKAKASF